MKLNIVSRQSAAIIRDTIQSTIGGQDSTEKVRHLVSYGEKIHEFLIESEDGIPVLLSLEGLQEIQAELGIAPWDLRVY